jgi:hypothetical protein
MRLGCFGKRTWLWAFCAGVGLGFSTTAAHGQIFHRGDSACPPPPCPTPGYTMPVPTPPPTAGAPTPGAPSPSAPTPPMPQTPGTDFSASAAESAQARGGDTASFAPNIFGDFQGGSMFVRRRGATVGVRELLSGRGPFKIADNESPRPQNRLFFDYNYYNNANITVPGLSQSDVHREVFGFEKTFLDGNASFGLRAPLIQVTGDGSVRSSDFGDLSIVLKYAWINDCATGNVLSSGLVVTTPTGPDLNTVDGNIHPTLLQPFVGVIWGMDNFYVQGFSSVCVPTDSRDVTLFLNDVAVSYRLYCNRGSDQLVTSVTPSFEVHVTTPLTHRNADAVIFIPDVVVLTGGVHVGLGHRSTLSLGVGTPITGPRPFDVEGLAQLNFRF